MDSIAKKVILIILDGWGVAKPSSGNAITSAKTPNISAIEAKYPSLQIQASGRTVGLPWGNEGNSEVGHLALGSGRIIFHYLPRIVNSIQDGSFFENQTLKRISSHVKKNDSSIHFMGLASSGSVHSYIDHVYGLLEFAKRESIEKVYLHIFTDGKDSPPNEAAKFVYNLDHKLKTQNLGKISTVIGRIYSMDRSGDWGATQKTYDLLVNGRGTLVRDAVSYIKLSYENGITDPYIEPAVVNEDGKIEKSQLISDNDAVIFFNFREDSARQLTKVFLGHDFPYFERKPFNNLLFTTLVKYEDYIPESNVIFTPPDISNTISEVISNSGKKQVHIAETEKYAHATYFFNGMREKPFPGEERVLIPSFGAPHYEKYPEMGAIKITDEIVRCIPNFDFILVNFANADMLSHLGHFNAIIKGVEVIDECIGRILKARDESTAILITSDHGNAEQMIDAHTGITKTEHSLNPVPVYLIHKDFALKKTRYKSLYTEDIKGLLSDVAPTCLELMGLDIPDKMTGQSLLPVMIN